MLSKAKYLYYVLLVRFNTISEVAGVRSEITQLTPRPGKVVGRGISLYNINGSQFGCH